MAHEKDNVKGMETRNKKIIDLFEKVQALPYFFSKHRDSRRLFELKKGCCAEKVIWLGNKFEEINIPVRYYLIEFRWESLPIPEHIIKLRKHGAGHHLVLKAKIKKKWIWIDPTWDTKLEKAGFPVTKNWDGENDTKLAVMPIKTKRFEPSDPSVLEIEEFDIALNKYLEEAREKSKAGSI